MFLCSYWVAHPCFHCLLSVWDQSEASCSSMLAFCHTHSTLCITTWSVLGVLGSCPWRLTSWASQICRTVLIWLPLCQTQKFFLLETLLRCFFFYAPKHKLIPYRTPSVFPHLLRKWGWRTPPNMTEHTRCSTTKQRSENISPDLLGAVLII